MSFSIFSVLLKRLCRVTSSYEENNSLIVVSFVQAAGMFSLRFFLFFNEN